MSLLHAGRRSTVRRRHCCLACAKGARVSPCTNELLSRANECDIITRGYDSAMGRLLGSHNIVARKQHDAGDSLL